MGFELMAAVDWNNVLGWTEIILKVLIGLGFVIFVHELGHFLVAKACGVKCEKFYIGFDIPMPYGIPSRFYRFQWGETEYGIGILPLGGYVKMLGQDDNPLNAEEEAERTRVREPEVESNQRSPSAANTAATAAAPPPTAADPAAGRKAQPKYELDPRSYTAKAVWQRMLIISAGVVMNLIFAVIFAAFAYRSGVPYTPCEIGQVIPGGPAWKAGVEPGTRLIQIGENGTKRETLRFDFDLRQSIATHGDETHLALLFRDRDGNEIWKKVRPFVRRNWLESSSTIGIAPAMTTKLASMPAFERTVAAKAKPQLMGGDTIVAIDGISISDSYQLTEYLARHPEKAIKIRVERAEPSAGSAGGPKLVDIQVPAQRLLDLGLVMQHGPITGLRPNSPAAQAGFREGDVILEVNGQPLSDPMLLPEVIRPFYGQEIEITVKRSGVEKPLAIRVTPVPPKSFDWLLMPGCSMASEALGVAYDVTRQVQSVVPGSPAAQAGLRPDDVVTHMRFRWEQPNADQTTRPGQDKTLPLDDRQFTWPVFFDQIQNMVPGEVVDLSYERQGKTTTTSLKPVEIAAFNPQRGFMFELTSEQHAAQSWREAMFLGARQTWEDAFRVVEILKKLVTRQVSVANLGGIGSIAFVAGSEASQGTSRLLIFLTMLSANLAVLNFLPIPALDGGHMMFLMYEAIFRKPVNERLQMTLTVAGVACLLGLIIFVNAMDIKRFLF